MKGRVLIVAGSDSGGGAGIQADIKAVTALDGFAMTAITALTAQNTLGVQDVMGVDPAFIQLQMRMVLDDLGADCIKTGMLHSAEVIDAVCSVLESDAAGIPVVVDPVMVAKGGAALLDPDSVGTLRDRLLPCAHLITPNIPEAEALLAGSISTVDDMKDAARSLAAFGPKAVLIKGGHMEGDRLSDVLLAPGETGPELHVFETDRVQTTHTHGTGCTLASAISAGIAQGMTMPAAVGRAQAYVVEAIRRAPGFGKGHGPVDHAHTVQPFGL